MTLPGSYLQVLRDCSLNEETFQQLVDLIEPLFQTQLDHYRTIAKNFPHGGMIVIDGDLRHLVADGQSFEYQGLSREAVEGKTLDELVTGPAAVELADVFRAALDGQRVVKEMEFGGRFNQFHTIPLPGAHLGMIIGVDITELQQRTKAQQDTQYFLDHLIKAVPDIIYIYDLAEKRNIYVNHEIAFWLGYSAQEVQDMGSRMVELMIHPDDQARVFEDNQKFDALLDDESLEIEYQVRHKNGEWRWLNSRRIVFKRDLGGKVVQILGIAQDITQRKHLEIALREKHDELDNFFMVTLDLWCVANTDGYFIKLNKRWEASLGYCLDELMGRRFLDFVHPDDIKVTQDAIELLDAQNPILNFTNRYRCKDGSYRFIEWNAHPQGKLIFAAARDITERKQLEAAQSQLTAIVTSSRQAIISRNLDGVITSWNRGAEEIFGYTAAEAIGNTMLHLLPPERVPNVINNLTRVKYGEHIEHYESEFIRKDGTQRWISMSISAIIDSDGNIIGGATIGQDITRRKELEAYQAQLTAIVESSGDGIIGRTLDGIITSWNRGAEQLYGYTAAEMIGTTMEKLIPADRLYELEANLAKARAGKYVERYETVRIHKNGTQLDVAFTISPIKDKDGTIIGVATINQNIGELKRIQNALRQSEARSHAVITTMTEGLVLQARNGSIEICNPAAERILGLTAEQMMGRTSIDPRWQAIHEDFTPFPGETHPAMVTLQTGQPVSNVVMGVYKPDGLLTWILINSQPLFQHVENQPYAVVASFTDITHIKHIEQALQESEARLRSIFETIDDAVWSMEFPSRRITYLNPAGYRIFGYPPDEFHQLTDPLLELAHPDEVMSVKSSFNEIVTTGHIDLQYRIVRPDGAIRWIHNRSWLIYDHNGQASRIEGIISDITESRLIQHQQIDLEIERERVQLLSDFISNTSHELRTPLTIIATNTYLMKRMDDPQQREIRAAQVEKQISYLNRMIGQLHEMVTLNQLRQLDLEILDLDSIVKEVFRKYSPRKSGVRLILDLNAHPNKIAGNTDYLSLAFSQLLDNAVRFSHEEGEVVIRTGLGEGEVYLEVEDSGVGIGAEHLDHIFKQFYKANRGRTRKDEGLGMGLAFVRQIMALHHGYVTVQSELERGSTFRLHFPLGNIIQS